MNTTVVAAVLRRLGGLVLTLFLASVVIFTAVLLTPGDPVTALAGGLRPTPDMIAEIKAQYLLDQPVWAQYLHWVTNVATGNLGQSFVYKTPVVDLIAPRVGITLALVVYTAVLIAVFGVGSGILAALRGPRAERAVLLATSLGMSLPTFVVAILLIWIFSRVLNWFPVYGAGDGLLDRIHHLTLPAVSLAVLYIAYVSRITRGALVGQASSEHVETARARGLRGGRIFRSHILLNGAPQILSISGVTVASLFAASAVAERAFGLGGLGSLLTEAAARKDLPVVQVLSLLFVAIFVVLNALVDAIIAVIDPSSAKRGSGS